MTLTTKDIKNAAERNLLEAFAMFPDQPLDLRTAAKWLWEDSGLDITPCYSKIIELAERGWLECAVGENRKLTVFMNDDVRDLIREDRLIYGDDHVILIWYCANAVTGDEKNPDKDLEQYKPFTLGIAEYLCETGQFESDE